MKAGRHCIILLSIAKRKSLSMKRGNDLTI
jgi:hypothetical protein